jgi:two-component system LytT family sensor kinase
MTVRLASVFRHVLAHSARPLTSVRDELAFLRTYLYIEEVRFGERLQVSIEASPEVEGAQIPSLILQPLVENALKHGLGPKVDVGHLWIRAAADGTEVRLTVEDDGEGLRPDGETGVGLANISDRLRTLYGERASVNLEAREGGGAVATVRIPSGM